ncbi:MAG: MFS transporter [Myxococcota bacterium]|nr:MFS transporter [Myxococcota bacterium]
MSADAPAEERASRRYAWYVLIVLFAAYVFNFADRQLLPLALEQIKQEMELSDTLLGLLLGLAFTMFYTLAGIPIAAWADRGNRRSIVALGLTVWSAMTAACGLAQNAGQLALARFGVGIGEAAGTPPSHSLISDYFPAERRATAMSVYAMGIYVGVLFGFVGGGYLIQWLSWRSAFVVLGLAGIPLALLLRLTVREPVRGAADAGATPPPSEALPLREVLRTLAAHPSFVLLTVGACFQALAGYAILSWGPAFLIRVHGMAPSELGLRFGLIAGIGGAAGATLGGVLTDRLCVRDPRWAMGLPALISLLAAPFALPFLLADARGTALFFFAIYYFVNNMYVGPLWSVAQGLVDARMRALASATLLTILNLVGLGAGPWIVGVMNDQLAPTYGDEAIRYSLLVMTLAGALAAIFFGLCARGLGREEAD